MKNSMIMVQFAKHMEAEQFSPGTVEVYTGQVARFYAWLNPRTPVICPMLERADVLSYKAYLIGERKVQPVTVNSYLSALGKYNEFLVEAGLQAEVVIRGKDYMKMQSVLSNPWDGEDEDVENLARAVLCGQKQFSVRDFAILTIMAYAGLRVSEVVNLEIDDIRFASKELFVQNGKGQKSRLVYMSDRIMDAIREYLAERPDVTHSYLFVSRTGRILTRRRIQQIISEHSEKLTPHKLRHYFCSQSQSVAGYSIMETANQAGHRNPSTTMRYYRKKAIMERCIEAM